MTLRAIGSPGAGLLAVLVGALAMGAAGCRGDGGDASPAKRLDSISAKAHRAIEDPDRAEAVAGIAEEMAGIVKAAEKRRAEARERLLALHRDPEATRADFEAVLRGEREQAAADDARMLQLRMQAADLTSPEEWAALVP